MAYNYQAGTAIQVVSNNITMSPGRNQTTSQNYTLIQGTNTNITIQQNNSKLWITGYIQGWGNGGNGANMAFILNGTTAGVNGGNGDGWCRALNGANGNRSWNIGRMMMWDHGLPEGSTITIGMALGAWTSPSHSAGWDTHPSYFNVTVIELEGL